jgi:hypothetical protein
MQVLLDNGQSRSLKEADSLMNHLLAESSGNQRIWLALPEEVKKSLGRVR